MPVPFQPEGYHSITPYIEEVSEEEMAKRMEAMMKQGGGGEE